MTTLVTAFVTDINQITFRSVETYIEYGKKLISLVPCICFIERHIYEAHFQEPFPLCTFIFFEKKDNYLYEHIDKIDFDVVTNNPGKDTLEYMFVQCHKTEFLRKAIETHPGTNFAWVDFGIYHMIGDELNEGILQLSTKSYSKVRIASCIDPHESCPFDIYRCVAWYFAGSVVGGDRESLVKFADLMKAKCLELVSEKRLMWEINTWYLVFQANPELFEPYRANHNISILKNY